MLLQLAVLLDEFLQLLLRLRRAGQRKDVSGKLLFAGGDVLPDNVRVFGGWIKFQILFVVINRGRGVALLVLIQHAELIMRGGGVGVHFERFLKGLDRTLIIHGVHPADTQHIVWLLLVVLVGRRAPAQRKGEQRDKEKPFPK